MSSKLGIAIDLNALEELMAEYVDEELQGDAYLLDQMRLGHFILWLRKRQQLTLATNQGEG